MEEIKYFTIKRALLLSLVIISGGSAVVFLFFPFTMSVPVDKLAKYHQYWPHVLMALMLVVGVFKEWGVENIDSQTVTNVAVFLPITTILLSSISSILFLRVSKQNNTAWVLSLFLALISFFLAWTFFLRSYLFLSMGNLVSLIDIIAAICFTVSVFFLGRLFSHFPQQLDYDLWRKLATEGLSPKIKSLSKLTQRFDKIDKTVDKFFFESIVPMLQKLFRVKTNTKKQVTHTWEFYDSKKYFLLMLLMFSGTCLVWVFSKQNAVLSVVSWGILLLLMFFYILIASLNFFAKLTAQYHFGSEYSRKTIEWIYSGIWLWIAVAAPLHFSSLLLFDSSSAGFAILVIAPYFSFILFIITLLLSVFYKGTIDPKLIIRKSTIYSVIAVVMTVIFVAIEGVLSTQAALQIGLPSQSGAVLAGTATTLLLGPMRNKMEAGITALMERIMPPSALSNGTMYETVVVFNDLGGYTSLSEDDEEKALLSASAFHKAGYNVAKKTKGRVVKTIGDAVMFEYKNVDDAFKGAAMLHQSFKELCDELGFEALTVHSGIHTGLVMKAKDGDIFGRTVNVAARLEGKAGENEIICSEAVKSKLTTEMSTLQSLGELALKNIPKPVECFSFKVSAQGRSAV